jgi:hypothetical protein
MIAFPSAMRKVGSRFRSRPKPAMIESPCSKVCALDVRSGLCLGCGRTIEEIARWQALSAAERARIMTELPDRLAGRVPAPAATG